ncbi:hypothetical protein HDR58_11075 [bacterium]|nr:hypothetical protein [bacterium]
MTKLTRKIQDLQSYSAMVGKGSVSIGDLLSSPGSMMNRSMAYMAWAHNSSMQYMQQNAPLMQQMYGQQMAQQTAQQQQQMNNYIQRMLYQQGRDRAAQVEAKNLHAEEQKLMYEKEKLEALAKSVEQELKSAREARDKGIQDFAPKYTA